MAKMEERPPPVIDYAKPLFKPCHVPHQRVLSPLPSHPFSLTPLAQKVRVYTWTSPFGFSFAGHMDPCPFSLPENAREFYFCQRLTLELRNGGGGSIFLHSLGQNFALLQNFFASRNFATAKLFSGMGKHKTVTVQIS